MRDYLGPMPDDPVEQALWHFLSSSNLSRPLHSLDKEKFDEFTVTAYGTGNRWTAKVVKKRLVKYRVNKVLVEELIVRFEIGIAVLTQQREMKREAGREREAETLPRPAN